MQVNPIHTLIPGATLFTRDGAPIPAPCTSRYCPPDHHAPKPDPTPTPLEPALLDHDGEPVWAPCTSRVCFPDNPNHVHFPPVQEAAT